MAQVLPAIPTILKIGTAVATGVSTYQSYESSKRQKKIAEDAQAQAEQQGREADKLKQEEQKLAEQEAMRRTRMKRKEPGLRPTILTGPLGVPEPVNTGRKTLLGL